MELETAVDQIKGQRLYTNIRTVLLYGAETNTLIIEKASTINKQFSTLDTQYPLNG